MFKKILIVFAAIILLIAVALGIFMSGGPEFPADTDSIIAEAIKSDPPELVIGTPGYAQSTSQSGNVKIWYEVNQPLKSFAKPKGTILLIMGAGASSMLWPPQMIQDLAKKGYKVIRFDHRGTGMSDWIKSWQQDKPYSLEDMASDALAVLDAAGVKKAHVVGTSMGGMIAQRLAISHGDRVASLVAMSTSAYMFDPELAELRNDFTLNSLRLILKAVITGNEAGFIKMWLGFIELMLGESLTNQDVRDVSNMVLYEMRKRRGFSQDVMAHHTAAIIASGSRLEELNSIKCPTLVIHGIKDAAIDVAHAKKIAQKIPNSKTLLLEDAGHILRERHMSVVHGAMFNLFDSVN